MSNILTSIKLDYYIAKSNYKIFLVFYVIGTLLGAVKQPPLTIVIVMVFSVFFGGTVFSISEKNNLNKLYGILPLEKSDAVIGRYLYTLIFGIINGIISLCLAYIISIITNNRTDAITFIMYLSAAFLYFCLAIGITFPIYFKFGFTKAYIFTMLPVYLIFLTGVFIAKKTNILSSLTQVLQYFTSHQNMIWIIGICGGLVLLAISCSAACLINKKREL